jgi:cytoskeletal protein CcmA (bactofilin family)
MSAMVDRTPEADTLYIGQGVTIKGAVVVSATVVVDGVLEGDIDVENLFVRRVARSAAESELRKTPKLPGTFSRSSTSKVC